MEKDNELVGILKKNYKKIYLWCQGNSDFEYSRNLDVSGIDILEPDLIMLDEVLKSDDEMDYVGTRLHAGIQALNSKRRAFIIGVDNRAIEISKDFNLNVIDRENQKQLEEKLNRPYKTKINLPFENIKKWKEQFRINS